MDSSSSSQVPKKGSDKPEVVPFKWPTVGSHGSLGHVFPQRGLNFPSSSSALLPQPQHQLYTPLIPVIPSLTHHPSGYLPFIHGDARFSAFQPLVAPRQGDSSRREVELGSMARVDRATAEKSRIGESSSNSMNRNDQVQVRGAPEFNNCYVIDDDDDSISKSMEKEKGVIEKPEKKKVKKNGESSGVGIDVVGVKRPSPKILIKLPSEKKLKPSAEEAEKSKPAEEGKSFAQEEKAVEKKLIVKAKPAADKKPLEKKLVQKKKPVEKKLVVQGKLAGDKSPVVRKPTEETKAVEEKPREEKKPVEKKKPADEKKHVEEKPAAQKKPVGKKPAQGKKIEEQKRVEEKHRVGTISGEKEPIIDEKPAEVNKLVDERKPVDERKLTDKENPAEGEKPLDENTTTEKIYMENKPAEESKPLEEKTTEEEAPEKNNPRTVIGEVAKEEEARVWNLRPRRTANKSLKEIILDKVQQAASKKANNKQPTGEANVRAKKPPNLKLSLSVSLTKQEIEEDFFSFTGGKPPRRPQKRHKNVQKQLDLQFLGLNLTGISTDSYK